MIETSLVGQLTGDAVKSLPQSLPENREKDASRFQDLMANPPQDSSTKIQPQSIDSSSVLQFVEPGKQVDETGLADRVVNMATQMDGEYDSLLSQMKNRPNFDSYLSQTKGGGDDAMLTYPNVNVASSKSSELEASLERIQNSQRATLEYQSDMNDWALNFRIWSASVEVVSAAAKKVSQGFQTLFRASG